jgi:hypothetical protein
MESGVVNAAAYVTNLMCAGVLASLVTAAKFEQTARPPARHVAHKPRFGDHSCYYLLRVWGY